MTITQTVDIPESRRFTIEVPRETPTGRANVVIFPVQKEKEEKKESMPHKIKGEFHLEGDFTEPLKERVFGCVKGDYWMSDDFCEPLEDFKDYM